MERVAFGDIFIRVASFRNGSEDYILLRLTSPAMAFQFQRKIRKSMMARRSNQALATAADLMLAPAVMWLRLPMLAAEAQSVHPARLETARATNEKTAAFVEGVLAAQLSLFQSAARFWPEVLMGRSPSILNGVAAERSLRAALQPVRKRVRSNFRRLSKA